MVLNRVNDYHRMYYTLNTKECQALILRVVLLLFTTMRAEHSFRHPLIHRCNTPIAITRPTSEVPDVLFMDLITCHGKRKSKLNAITVFCSPSLGLERCFIHAGKVMISPSFASYSRVLPFISRISVL